MGYKPTHPSSAVNRPSLFPTQLSRSGLEGIFVPDLLRDVAYIHMVTVTYHFVVPVRTTSARPSQDRPCGIFTSVAESNRIPHQMARSNDVWGGGGAHIRFACPEKCLR